MRITSVREKTIVTSSRARNAGVGFEEMTASVLLIETDVRRDGKPLVGLALDSPGRYGHGGVLRERFIPRLLAAEPGAYRDEARGNLDPFAVWNIVMRNEKPGGHGERAGAVGLIDAAIWDLVAKVEGRPLWAVLAERFADGESNGKPDGKPDGNCPVYATCGYYGARHDPQAVADEVRRCRDLGYERVKIKIGGATLAQDLERLEAAIGAMGAASAVAVDCNGTLNRRDAFALAGALDPYGLAWLEEPVDPLDFDLHRELAERFDLSLATGENLFSAADARNLFRHGGLRPDRDYLQMDVSLSYGIVEYLRIVESARSHGWQPARFLPHAGHALALQVVAGLGLGAHETSPFSAHGAELGVAGGRAYAGDAPGVGIEARPALFTHFADLIQ